MDLRQKQRAVVDALEDIKGHDIVVYNTAALPTMFERVVIASGDSTRQVKALADNVQEKLEGLGARVYGVEGAASSEWILVDFGDLVVHVMHPTVRSFYNLEEIWGGKDVKLAPTKKVNASPRKPAKKAAKKPLVRKASAARAKAARSGRSR
jgi:ribosome-associated protein